MKELYNTMPQIGKVEYISIRPEKKGVVEEVEVVMANTENGLEGDHYHATSGTRQVTLLQLEHMEVFAKILGIEKIDLKKTRRNIAVSGINLLALKDRRFQIGEAILETTGHCVPCSKMERNFGPGAFNAMRGHGGITTRVIQGGKIKKGDKVKLIVNKE